MPYNTPATWRPEPFLILAPSGICMGEQLKSNGSTVVSANWPVANLAMFYPFRLTRTHTYVTALWVAGTVVGSPHIDVGLYDAAGTRLGSTGSTLVSGSTTLASAALTASVTLSPGTYYLAVAQDIATSALVGGTPNNEGIRFAGVKQMATAFPLPATATFAALVNSHIPVAGVTELSYV